MMYLVRGSSIRAVARALVIALLAGGGCVSQACPDGQKLADGKCVSKSDTHDGGSPDAEKEDGGAEQGGSKDIQVDGGEPAEARNPCGGMISTKCWEDTDRDGFAVAASETMQTCGGCPSGWTSVEPVDDQIDCKGSDADLHPIRCWRDRDKDGFAANAESMTQPCAMKCAAGTTSAEPVGNAVDCDDKSEDIHPNALEACNGDDDDCDHETDEDAGKACNLANASAACVHATCQVDECKEGFDDCDHNDDNGCEQALNVAGNCGGCGIECSVLGTCSADEKVGQCVCEAPSFGDGGQCQGPGPFSTGSQLTCTIDGANALKCWGDEAANVAGLSTTSAKFQQIEVSDAVFETVACGLTRGGRIQCWGDKDLSGGPEAASSKSEFIQVAVGTTFTCGLNTELHAECWMFLSDTSGTDTRVLDVPDTKFTQIAAGGFHVCGLRADGFAECWGAGAPGTQNDCTSSLYNCGQGTPPSEKFVQLAAGAEHTCGLQRDGKVLCWGAGQNTEASTMAGEYGQAVPPADIKMTWISAGLFHTCGVRADDGSPACWGAGSDTQQGGTTYNVGQARPPVLVEPLLMVSAGTGSTCGLTTSEDIVCWGTNANHQAPPMIDGPFPLVPGTN
jgi:hypothetical protein